MLIDINKIKPDPDQPRRTFNEEKMEALEGSMRADGFRESYPIIVDEDLIILDGERRWRIAKKLGIKKVPAEVKTGVSPALRLLYQLQSEGAELDFIERNKAWAKLWELSKDFSTRKELSDKLGVPEETFRGTLIKYETYKEALNKLGNKKFAANVSYDTLVEVGTEDKEVIEKAVEEKWTRDKSREIKKAIQEFPHRKKEILSRDYSDPVDEETGEVVKGSDAWRHRLKVATMDIDFDELHKSQKVWKDQEVTFDAYDVILTSAARLRTALDKFDYTIVAPEVRVSIHKELSRLFPAGIEWLKGLEKYMADNGELTGNSKQLK